MNYRKLIIISILFSLTPAHAQHLSTARPDSHAPISVMGDHLHKKGEVMFSYRYMGMDMSMGGMGHEESHDDMAIMEPGIEEHSADDHSMDMTDTDHLHDVTKAHNGVDHSDEFTTLTDKHTMSMEMHMLEAMYGLSDDTSVMAMLPFWRNQMDHGAHGATDEGSLITRNEGMGDLSLSVMQSIYQENAQRIHLTAGMSLPTGDIKNTDIYHNGETRHPYMMTIGSGTFDFLPGVTYVGQSEDFSWGAQAQSVIRIGRNSEDYSLGNRYKTTGWGAWRISRWVSISSRLTGDFWQDVDGMDDKITITSMMADPKSQAGRVLEAGIGFNIFVPEGALKGHRFGIEVGFPVTQDNDAGYGDQDWSLTAGWQKSF